MADEPQKVNVQARRVDQTILPNNFSQPYRLYVIQQNTDMQNIAGAANGAGELAYEATVRNEEQDLILADHENRISALRIEVDDHEIRITGNTSAIAALSVRVTTAEGNITTLQANVTSLQTNVTSLSTRMTTAEENITTLQGDYVSKSAVTSQTLASPLNVATSYSVGATKVVGARKTGWTASTGTASRSGINGSTAYTVSATYMQAEIQAIATGLQQIRQWAVAMQTDMGATSGHGLINA
ncbi:phage tail protein [Enterobacter ludwigii]|uniref:phage tail protein n=1 Tax=Enterobacter ludwigii TaxID=299767 RepID=UPI003974E2D2